MSEIGSNMPETPDDKVAASEQNWLESISNGQNPLTGQPWTELEIRAGQKVYGFDPSKSNGWLEFDEKLNSFFRSEISKGDKLWEKL